MPISENDLYEALCECMDSQFDFIEQELSLDTKFLRKEAASSRAKALIQMLKQRRDPKWREKLAAVLNKAMNNTANYFLTRLKLIKKFLLEPPPEVGGSAEDAGTIKELRQDLAELEGLKEPVLVKVRGTLFPAALLATGWWERKKSDSTLCIEWKTPLQQWLFQGFDLWAPSWDISWEMVGATERPSVAQLTDGDEADSLPVIVPPGKAAKLREEFRDGWGGFECEVTGLLGHRYQFEKKLPKGTKGEPTDYYISLDNDDKKHRIVRSKQPTELYSGYLWKCVAPRDWLKDPKAVGLDDVYFVWEHTNFAAKEALAYNLEGLAHKEEQIARLHPGSELVLLQKSHALVPGNPQWQAQQFYDLLMDQGKVI
jgi:hypothetical protein